MSQSILKATSSQVTWEPPMPTTRQLLNNHHTLSNEKLLHLCQTYGSQAKLWRQKFLGLLPEVERRRLYEQKRCSSIFEFAAKLGGVSREQVLLVLRLDKKFESIPKVKEALVSGEVSVTKLARVASVVTVENQDFWVNQSQLLSSRALETLVKDTRVEQTKSMHVHALNQDKGAKKVNEVPQAGELNLSEEIKRRLLVLQNKGLDLNKILSELLDQREHSIQGEKERIGKELNQKSRSSSRYVPLSVKAVLKQEFGSKCAHPQCANQAVNIHHTGRFGLTASHDPFYLAPLCKLHHEIAHAIDVRVVELRKFSAVDSAKISGQSRVLI